MLRRHRPTETIVRPEIFTDPFGCPPTDIPRLLANLEIDMLSGERINSIARTAEAIRPLVVKQQIVIAMIAATTTMNSARAEHIFSFACQHVPDSVVAEAELQVAELSSPLQYSHALVNKWGNDQERAVKEGIEEIRQGVADTYAEACSPAIQEALLLRFDTHRE